MSSEYSMDRSEVSQVAADARAGRERRDADRGLYGKFQVSRTDGRSGPGEKHDGCNYFILDMTHDPHAIPAVLAYAESCAATHPALSKDLKALYRSTDSEGSP